MTATVVAVSAVDRARQLLSVQVTFVPTPRLMSVHVSAVGSLMRSPVWNARTSRARSRRPVHRLRSEAAIRASALQTALLRRNRPHLNTHVHQDHPFATPPSPPIG